MSLPDQADKELSATTEIIATAVNDALLFHEEFPDEKSPGDWDSEAWSVSAMRMEEAVATLGESEAWKLYSSVLRAEVNYLFYERESEAWKLYSSVLRAEENYLLAAKKLFTVTPEELASAYKKQGLKELTRMTEEFGGYEKEFPKGDE